MELLEDKVSVLLSPGNLSLLQEQEVVDVRRTLTELQESQKSVRKGSLEVLRSLIDQVQRPEE